jgi:hypothetical protein
MNIPLSFDSNEDYVIYCCSSEAVLTVCVRENGMGSNVL